MLLRLRYPFTLLLFLMTTSAWATSAKLEIPSDQSLGFFVGTRDETLASLKRVGLLPVRLPTVFEDRDDVKAALSELVTQYLTQAGMQVIKQDSYTSIYDRLNLQLGGVYDPQTGNIKPEQMRALLVNATREFNEKEHLNGNVIINVRSVEAKFFGTDAYFDGAKECSLGRMPPSALTNFLIGNPNLRGDLPAYSVAIQLINSQGKVVFGQMGGIQLSNYYDPGKSKGANGFLYVPAKNLLLDSSRLERAVRIATQPLLQTPEQIAKDIKNPKTNPRLIEPETLPLPPEGVSRPADSPFLEPREQILSKVHKVFLAPFSTGGFSISQEAQERYLTLIETELKPLHWEVVHSSTALKVWQDELKNTKRLFNPYTGKMDEALVKATRKKALETLGLGKDDAILWPSLVRTIAPYRQENAKWDGTGQNVYTLEPLKKRGLFDGPINNSEGSVAAISLSLHLRGADDNILYQARGGIQLIQQVKDSKPVDLAPSELFVDQSREQPAVHIALRHLVLDPDDLDNELHPGKEPENKKKKKEKTNH